MNERKGGERERGREENERGIEGGGEELSLMSSYFVVTATIISWTAILS